MSAPPLSYLTFLWAALWVLLSLRVRLSEMLEAVCPEAEADLEPILSLRLLRISESLWVTVGCLTAWVWCLLSWTSLDMLLCVFFCVLTQITLTHNGYLQ